MDPASIFIAFSMMALQTGMQAALAPEPPLAPELDDFSQEVPIIERTNTFLSESPKRGGSVRLGGGQVPLGPIPTTRML